MQFCHAAPGSKQKLQAGVKQTPTWASRGAERVPARTWWRGSPLRPPPYPHLLQPALLTPAGGRNCQACLFVCLFVVSSSLGAHDQQHPKGVGAEFPSSECVRGILNGKPDQKSSDQPSSDYSPLAPPFLPPPPDLHKKGEENSGWAPAAAHSAPPGRSPPKLRSGFLHEAKRTAPLPRSPPRARRPGAPVAWPPAFQAP